MNENLPTYKTEGLEFVVNIERNYVYLKDSYDPSVSFSEMTYTGEGYSFYYDTKPYSEDFDPDTYRLINLPQKVVLDPVAMSVKYGLTIGEIKTKSDFDIIVDQQIVKERMLGVLPRILIDGYPFIIDMRLKELRPVDLFHSRIELDKLDPIAGSLPFTPLAGYCGFYQTDKKAIMDTDVVERMTNIPKNLMYLELPGEIALDPFHYARQGNYDLKDILMKYPPKRELSAKLLHVSKTNLETVVAENRKKNERQSFQRGPGMRK